MAFVTDDFSLKKNVPTLSVDAADPPKFSQLVETTKDTFIEELRKYFAQSSTSAARFAETLNIEKYGISQQFTDPFVDLITIIREYPDILQKLPLISVTKASGGRKPISLTGAFVDHVQYPPRVRSTNPEPYDLSAILNAAHPPTLNFRTKPEGTAFKESTMSLAALFFPTPAATTIQQIADAINFQALYARARPAVSGANQYLELVAGGASDSKMPGYIEITGGTPALLTALGFTVGQSDSTDNPARPVANRYGTGASFTIGIDVGATSDNERTELTDLLVYFFNLYMADRDYTFYGEHVFEEPVAGATTERYFQIILGDWTIAGEADVPRPDGEREDKIYVNRFNIPVTVFDYVDRVVPPNLIPPVCMPRQHNFQANAQPVNISGVSITAPDNFTRSGIGTLTYEAGTIQTLVWQAPTSLVPGAAVPVGAGGMFTLPGGDGSSILVTVSTSGLPLNQATQPVSITGVRIDAVGASSPAGVGTLSYAIAGAARNLTWDPPGAEGPGAPVDVAAGGLFAVIGAGGSSLAVRVDPLALLSSTPLSDAITITTVFTDSIALNRDELPAAS